jgi:transcriptional regulator with XRE-family HTH domain
MISMGGDLIKEARRRAGLTQAELAVKAGTTQSAIARWERGAVSPSFDTVRRLLRLCGFHLNVALERWDDGLIDDWQQAQVSLRHNVDWRLDANRNAVTFAKSLRAANVRTTSA